jgi:peptide/nickel transport system substrate-binding protein
MFSSRTSRLKHGLSRGALIGIVVVVIIIIAVGGYLAISSLSHTSTTASTSSVGPKNSSQFIDETIGTSPYDSLDPHYGFFTVDGFFPNVFQGLLTNAYNGTVISSTQVAPALATGYTVGGGSPICVAPTAGSGGSSNCVPASGSTLNDTQFNFAMRAGTKFSNNDPVNAYVAWFSFVRVLWYNAPTTVGISNYALLTVNTTMDEPCANGTIKAGGCGQNIWPDGLMNAVGSVLSPAIKAPTMTAPITEAQMNTLVGALNQMLTHFDPTNTTQQKIMSYPAQAYVANSSSDFVINTIQPYSLMPLALTAQWADVVDPVFIDQHGGVQNNSAIACASNPNCTYFNNNGMPGTGPYMYNCPSQCPADHTSLELVKNPNYWNAGNASGLNKVLEPASIPNIIMKFGLQPSTIISDFASNNAQTGAIPFAQMGQAWSQFHSAYPQYSLSQVFSNQGYPLCDLAIGINTQVSPSIGGETYTGNSTGTGITPGGIDTSGTTFSADAAASQLVRQAIVHAVNYSAILQQTFSYNGTNLGELFIPPVPPGFGPLDNPGNIPLYSYNITQSAIDLDQAGKVLGFYTIPSSPITFGGTSHNQLGDNTTGKLFSAIPLVYLVPLTPTLQTQFNIINAGLNQLGLAVAPTGETTGVYDSQVASPTTTPQMVTVGWCADWADPIYQQFYDMGTSVAHTSAWPDNATLNVLLQRIPFETNPTQQINDAKQAYLIFSQMATIVQIPNGIDNGAAFFIQPYVHGLLYSFAQFGFQYNTATYT